MEFTASQIAGFLNGTVEGNPEIKVSTLSKIEEGKPGTLTFLANMKYHPFIYTTRASVVVVSDDFVPNQPLEVTLIRVPDPYTAFARLLEMYNTTKASRKGISPQAYLAPTAKVGENVSLGEFTYVGEHAVVGNNVQLYPQVYIGDNVTIGDDTVLYPGVKVYTDCIVGKRCTLHAGVVVGSDGFGFAPQAENIFKKVPQIGNVIIEDDVEVGSNTTIDRATLGSTILRKGVKLDNLIQVAHNVEVGENTVIAAQSGISGSTKIGKNCMVAGQVGFVGHLVIGDNVKVGAQSGIENNLKDNNFYLGSPAQEISKTRKIYVHWRNLDQIVKRINVLEKLLKNNHHE